MARIKKIKNEMVSIKESDVNKNKLSRFLKISLSVLMFCIIAYVTFLISIKILISNL